MRWVWIALLVCSCSSKSSGSQPAPEIDTLPARSSEAASTGSAAGAPDEDRPLFMPPDHRTRFAAAGSLAMLSEPLQRAFSSEGFTAIAAPEPGDWLAQHPEPGQTYDQFVAARFQRPAGERKILYVLPIGALDERRTPAIGVLSDFLRAYFQMPVEVMPAVGADGLGVRSRARRTGTQLHAGDILEALRKRLPKDAFSLIAITETDLYPQDDWNFVFGMAKLRHRVGVHSFARYHPGFYSDEYDGYNFEGLILDRSLKVMAHEVGHMFGLEHCVFYECVINGSNSMGETDKSPSHLCPVDLRKLHHSIRFDPAVRYRDLEAFYRRHKMAGHAAWVGSQRAFIEQ